MRSLVTIRHGTCISLEWHALHFCLLPALLSSPPLSPSPGCSGPGQAEEEAGCWHRKVDLPWFLHLMLALGRTCRKECGLWLLSDAQGTYDLIVANTHTHTKGCAEAGRGLGRQMPAGKAFWWREPLSWDL